MHLAERYATSCGVKINRPELIDLFFPILEDKFITIDTSHSEERCRYTKWQQVLRILAPLLKENNISVFQIGDPHARSVILAEVNNTLGATNYNQLSFLLKRSLLHLGSGALTSQIAANLNKLNVCVLPWDDRKSYQPFWGKNNFIISEGENHKRTSS